MGFIKFEGLQGGIFIRIPTDWKMSTFSKAAVEKYELDTATFCTLFYDKDTPQIGVIVHRGNRPEGGVMLAHTGKMETQRKGIRLASFAEAFSLPPREKSGRCVILDGDDPFDFRIQLP